MKNYKEFISNNNISEGAFGDAIRGIASYFRGDKRKITEYVQQILSVEKEFINKSDELSYDIFLADNKKSQDPVVSTNLKQKSIMSRRALDSMAIAKNSEISSLVSSIIRICKKNPDLLDFYKSEKALADVELSKYAYNKAKQFNDQKYEDQFYDQWKELEDKVERVKTTEYRRDSDNDYRMGSDDLSGDIFDTTKYTDLGNLGLSIREYSEYVSSLPGGRNTLNDLLDEAIQVKYYLDEDFSKRERAMKRENELRGSREYQEIAMMKEKFSEVKIAYMKAKDKVLGKISFLRKKLNIKED